MSMELAYYRTQNALCRQDCVCITLKILGMLGREMSIPCSRSHYAWFWKVGVQMSRRVRVPYAMSARRSDKGSCSSVVGTCLYQFKIYNTVTTTTITFSIPATIWIYQMVVSTWLPSQCGVVGDFSLYFAR